MEHRLVYEHPLNESIRTLLRAEDLFNRLEHHAQAGTSAFDMRLLVSLLTSLHALLKWSDVKIELARELERYRTVLRKLEDNPGVDARKLKSLLEDIDECVAMMRDNAYQPGATLESDKLIASVRQKDSLAGGACHFDLPAYHYWLNLPLRERQKRLHAWQEDLSVVRKGINTVLDMIRNNARSSTEVATGGAFQQSVETDTPNRLIRIVTKGGIKCFPEISGGKHRLTVRFLEQPDPKARPSQTSKDVHFELHFCV